MREVNDRPGKLAFDLMRRAIVIGLGEDAARLAATVREIQRPLPTLPLDATERELALMILLLQAQDRERRLLTVICD